MLGDTRKVLAVALGSAGQIGLSVAAALVTTFLLPVSDRGRYVLMITVLAISAPLAGIGTNVGLRRERPTSTNPRTLETSYLKFSICCAFLHGFIAGPLLFLITREQVPRSLLELVGVGLVGVTQVLSWQFLELWFARLSFRVGAIYATLNSATMLFAAAWALAQPNFVTVVWAQALSGLILQATQLAHISRTLPAYKPAGRATERGVIRRLARVGAPSLVMTAGMALAFRLDRLMLGVLSGAKPVAIYALAAGFSELPRFIPAAFGQIANGHAAQQRGRLPLRPYLLPSGILSIGAAAAAGAIGVFTIRHLDKEYHASVAPLIVLLVSELLLVPYSIVVRMILGGGRVHLSAAVGLVALGMSGLVYWFMIARFGLMGAAWGSLLVYTGVSVATLLVHRQQEESL